MDNVQATPVGGRQMSGRHEGATWLTLPEVSERTGKKLDTLRTWARRNASKERNGHVRKEQSKYGTQWLIHSSMLPNLGGDVEACVGGRQMSGRHEEATNVEGGHVAGDSPGHTPGHTNLITFEAHLRERKEWEEDRDRIISGLMMYRYKYEELDRKLRLLPAPPEMIQEEIRKRNEITEQARKELSLAQGELEQVRERVCEKEEVIKAEVEHRENLTLELGEKQAALAQAQEILRDAHQKNELYESSLTELKRKLQEEEAAKAALVEELKSERAKSWWKRLLGIK